jgi:hypothetical protein
MSYADHNCKLQITKQKGKIMAITYHNEVDSTSTAVRDVNNHGNQSEELYWSLPLFVTKSTPDRPCVMKSSGIMDSILSFLKDKFS